MASDAFSTRAEEIEHAGAVCGILWTVAGVTFATFLVLPGVSHAHRVWVLAISALACPWGLAQIRLIDWRDAPRWLIHASVSAGLVTIALAIASTGGANSPAWVYLFFVAVFASRYFPAVIAAAYLVGCILTHSLALLYDPRAFDDQGLAQFVVAAPAYLALGGALVTGRALMLRLRVQAERLVHEQSSLRRVATAVVEGAPPARIYEVVAREAAELLRGGAAGILRLAGPNEAVVEGSWSDHPGGRYEPGTVVAVKPGSDMERALQTGRPVRVDEHPPASPVGDLGYKSSIVAPIRVAGRTWGLLAAAAAGAGQLTSEDEERLGEFGDLLATAIANLEDRAKLSTQALTDPLTGLANHRSLQMRLASETSRVDRRGGTLSVALIDIDHFKQINDEAGHEAGDETLAAVARCISEMARGEDTVGRAGGDEFAWILPDTNREQALIAVERARRTLSATISRPYRITVSAGICDTSVTTDPVELMRLADGALYWSKANGRNQCWVFDPEVVKELSAQERAERLQRSQALLGLRALARAIDAKDPATREHSERVSSLVTRLATLAGWSTERTRLLGEAALVHDVGKIGIPDAVLSKTAPLTPEERQLITEHAELSGRIVEGVLAPEQVEWVRTHHERPDGDGYPDGLCEEDISDGAALLAVADAWDVMTVSRPYSLPKTADDALRECLSLVGKQFTERAVAALTRLYTKGELDGAYPGRHSLVKLLS